MPRRNVLTNQYIEQTLDVFEIAKLLYMPSNPMSS